MKPSCSDPWAPWSVGVIECSDPYGHEDELTVGVFGSFIYLTGKARMDWQSMQALGKFLIEGSMVIKARSREPEPTSVVDQAIQGLLNGNRNRGH